MISGRSLPARGGPDSCVIVAHDAETGAELWRTRTVPAPGEPGDETWGDTPFEDRTHVGTWMVPSYDPGLELIYIGTSVTSPAPKFLLGGRDLAAPVPPTQPSRSTPTPARSPGTTSISTTTGTSTPLRALLVDTAVAPDADEVDWINPRIEPGETRKVMTGIPGKTGVVYTLDRETGEFLWARPTIRQNVIP